MLGFFEGLQGLGAAETNIVPNTVGNTDAVLAEKIAELYNKYDLANTNTERKAIATELEQLLGQIPNTQNEAIFKKKVKDLVASNDAKDKAVLRGLMIYVGFAITKLLVSPAVIVERIVKDASVNGMLQLISELIEKGVRIAPKETIEAYKLFANAAKTASTENAWNSAFSKLLKSLGIPVDNPQWQLTLSTVEDVVHGTGSADAMDEATKKAVFEIYFLLNFLMGFLLGGLKGKPLPKEVRLTKNALSLDMYNALRSSIAKLPKGQAPAAESSAAPVASKGGGGGAVLLAALGIGAVAGAYYFLKGKK